MSSIYKQSAAGSRGTQEILYFLVIAYTTSNIHENLQFHRKGNFRKYSASKMIKIHEHALLLDSRQNQTRPFPCSQETRHVKPGRIFNQTSPTAPPYKKLLPIQLHTEATIAKVSTWVCPLLAATSNLGIYNTIYIPKYDGNSTTKITIHSEVVHKQKKIRNCTHGRGAHNPETKSNESNYKLGLQATIMRA